MSLVVNTLCKNYGHQVAVNEVSFELKPGEIVGFLGPNGAGKSTTLKMLAGFLEADKASILLNASAVHPNASDVKKQIGYLPESNALYQDLYVKEYLQFLTAVHSITNASAAIQSVIEKTGLGQMQNKKIAALSKGYKQRLGIAAAIIHQPTLILLDEPTAGLDPNQLVEIRELIKNIGKNKTVFLSTHIMQEVEAICERVIIINNGKLVTDKNLSNLVKEQAEQTIEVEFDQLLSSTDFATLENLTNTNKINDFTWELTFESNEDKRGKVFDFAKQKGFKILQLSLKNKNLEQIFREKTAKK